MTDLQNPIGLMIQAQGLDGAHKTKLLAHATKANYKTVTIMDDFGFAVQFKDALPGCIVVHRDSTFEPQPDYAGESFRSYIGQYAGDKRIVLMVNCEQGFDPDRVFMWLRLLEVAVTRGQKLCVGNVSSGSVKCGQGDDANDWLNIARPLLTWLTTHPGHYLGFHEYSFPFPWSVSNGAYGEPNFPPSNLDWTLPQWHVGRNVQGITSACKALNIAPPQCIVTEGVIDTMNDIAEHFGMKADGYKALSDYWNKVYPGKDHGDVLADMHEWTWEKAYQPCGFIVGMHTFCYGDASGRWANYQVDNEPRYLERMESYRGGLPAPIPAPAPVPIPVPADDSPRPYFLQISAGTMRPSEAAVVSKVLKINLVEEK